jgi:hypothetical protein
VERKRRLGTKPEPTARILHCQFYNSTTGLKA